MHSEHHLAHIGKLDVQCDTLIIQYKQQYLYSTLAGMDLEPSLHNPAQAKSHLHNILGRGVQLFLKIRSGENFGGRGSKQQSNGDTQPMLAFTLQTYSSHIPIHALQASPAV